MTAWARTSILVAAIALLGQAAHAEESTPEARFDQTFEQTFDQALADYYAAHYAAAAAGFFGHMHAVGESGNNYEWSQFFLAECLRELGLWHAAVQYYVMVAKTRSAPEILPGALARLQEISQSRPYSEDLLDHELVYDTDFGTLPKDLANWVHYVQGVLDLKNGFNRWATRHFQELNREHPYALRARFVEGAVMLKRGQDEQAAAIFEEITKSKIDEPVTKNRAYLALGRILYDLGNFKEAMTAYGNVQQLDLSFEQAQLLMEKAWTAYQLKDYRQALGLLQALDAPSYERFLVPDAFVLRAIVLKELCHFIPAKRVLRAFRMRYGRAIEQLHQRAPLQRNRVILEGATQDGRIARRTAFVRTLEAEQARIADFDSAWEDVGLDAQLAKLYSAELEEQSRRWQLEFDANADAAAKTLLEALEQVGLLDYEVGLDIFARIKPGSRPMEKEPSLEIPYDSDKVYYEFDGEFWNDELHDYQYFVNNRCFDTQEGSSGAVQ